MPDLSTEVIIFCILARLTAKDVVRCKSVCKEWRDLLSTEEFEHTHCSQSCATANQRTILIHELYCAVYDMDFKTCNYGPGTITPFPIQVGITNVGVLAHIDGLLCAHLLPTNHLVLWNPTTSTFKNLSTIDGHGLYEDIRDTVGMYKGPSNDYTVLHVARKATVIQVHTYSRRLKIWRQIPFHTKNEYASNNFYWSAGTLCGGTLYFTVCECWVVGTNVLIAFDTSTELLTEINFPPIPTLGIFEAMLANVRNTLHMVITTGMQDMSFKLWALQQGHWVTMFSSPPIPPIPMSSWLTITHYMTNGSWFVMNGQRKMYEIPLDNNPLECFYTVSCFRGHVGTVYFESVVSPYI